MFIELVHGMVNSLKFIYVIRGIDIRGTGVRDCYIILVDCSICLFIRGINVRNADVRGYYNILVDCLV